MDSRYIKLERRPELERPVLIVAFSGWNDAAEAASVTLGTLGSAWESERFGVFDPELFYDFQATRPQIKFDQGASRKIEWPENELRFASKEEVGSRSERDAVLFSGPEPNYRWHAFSEAIADLAEELGVELVITLGALLADVPHSRPVAVTAISEDPNLIEGLDVASSSYEGPTGITGVVHAYCANRGLPSVSLWASVPHYLPSVPSAPAALALIENLSGLLGTQVDTSQLEKTASEYQEQVASAVSQDQDLASYVQMLEERYDSQDGSVDEDEDLPSGDDLAQELEGFLKNQRGDDPPKE